MALGCHPGFWSAAHFDTGGHFYPGLAKSRTFSRRDRRIVLHSLAAFYLFQSTPPKLADHRSAEWSACCRIYAYLSGSPSPRR